MVACSAGDSPSGEPSATAASASTCTGLYATVRTSDNTYGASSMGCWTDENGDPKESANADCVPGCLAEVRSAGLCTALETGKVCEQQVTWFVSGAGRYACLSRVRVKNPATGSAVVAVVLDYGPNCSVERRSPQPLFGVSGRVAFQLFGSETVDPATSRVEVSEVPSTTSLGPERL